MSEAVRSLLGFVNQLLTTTASVWWRCLPRLVITAALGWFGYTVFAQLAAVLVDTSAWLSLLSLSIGFVFNLSAIIIGLRIAGQELQIRQAIPLPEDDPRDSSISHLLSITLLPFLGIYAVFDVITRAANNIQIHYYLYKGLTFETPLLEQLNPNGSVTAALVLIGVIVGLYVARRLLEWLFERTQWRPLGLIAALVEGFFMLLVVLSGRQILVSVSQWTDGRLFRTWLDYPMFGLEQVSQRLGVDLVGAVESAWTWWWEGVWPGVTTMVIEPMLWLALAALVYGSQVVSIADLWSRGKSVEVRAPRAAVTVGDRGRRVALEVQEAFFGDLNDKYLPTFQSLRLVLGVGASFFGAFILCYGVLQTGEQLLRQGITSALGGHPPTFWAMANPAIDLVMNVTMEPLRWVLLAVSFRACLLAFAARPDQPIVGATGAAAEADAEPVPAGHDEGRPA